MSKTAAPAAPAPAVESKVAAPKSFARRDHLRANEQKVQEKWARLKVFEANAEPGREKFFVTFPYPYMNGRLHLGHAFSLTKAEFTARYQRMKGKNVLFPFGFHCTGMPIQAAANKLKEEIATYGCPPVFPSENAEEEAEAAPATETTNEQVDKLAESTDALMLSVTNKTKGKKTKLAVKGQGGGKKQWQIMEMMVKPEEIPAFVDPYAWLDYFPPLGVQDLQSFGTSIDWRRSFITTDVCGYYDAFVRWQFNVLKEVGKVNSGYRPNIYSIKDKQTCADHDRASGEAVVPQEYTLIKLQILTDKLPADAKVKSLDLEGKKLFLTAATLRPETMYGQTNCYLLPEGEYGAYLFQNNEVYIMSERSALGLAHQGYALEWGKVICLGKFLGSDLLGLPLKAPLTSYEVCYTLPLITITMDKGTGVVTSVPSDAPDDYIALKELKDKPLWREKFGITSEMVEPYAVLPVVDIPGYGVSSAATLCEKYDVKSSKDKDKLKAIKDEVYLKGFYEGIMVVGPYTGLKVMDAKPLVRKQLIEEGLALPYYEPESTVISRSGDECIVALTDQWYLKYGDEEWQKQVLDHIKSGDFNSYGPAILDAFDKAVNWLKEWACSREFGLGTKLPWDPKWVIDSLSDSTVYMAYYTIAKFFHGAADNLKGSSSVSGILPQDLTDDIFNYIFLNKPLPEASQSTIPSELLATIKQEFEYWYPLDLRVSAKDLIPNHLTMCLYNHAAIFPQSQWPKGMYCNGHTMVDSKKMSKSLGNFLLMKECVDEYTADATRFALADAGDGLEDANFERPVVNQAISYLYVEQDWIVSFFKDYFDETSTNLRSGPSSEWGFMDRTFYNEINYLIEATTVEFEQMHYRDGLHRCWYDMIIARDFYRDWANRCNILMHKDILMHFIRSLILMIQPICPHWSEYLFELMTKDSNVSAALTAWPVPTEPVNPQTRKEYNFFKNVLKNIRQTGAKASKGQTASTFGKLKLFVSKTYEAKKIQILLFMQEMYQSNQNKFKDTFAKELKTFIESKEELKKETKNLMQFGSFMKNEAEERGIDALAVTLPFNQKDILSENALYLCKVLDMNEVVVMDIGEDVIAKEDVKKSEQAVPGKPTFAMN